jgi:hypothetical protein
VKVLGISGAQAIGAGYHHSCATLMDGTTMCWGNDESGQLGNGAVAGEVVDAGSD